MRIDLAQGRLITCVLAGLWIASVHNDARSEEPSRYEFSERHDPEGVGKFYLGREIAHVMGPGGILWLERPERELEERPDLMIGALGIRPGQMIADLGAGSGYYTFRIAPLAGHNGRVLAIDIEETMLGVIRERARREGVENIRAIRSTAKDPNLPAHSIDLLFMVDVYHELEFPYEMMEKVRAALKPGGRIALIEYRKEDPAVMIKEVHKMTERQIVREMTTVGFRHINTVRTLPLQHLVLFEVNRDW